MRSKNRPSEYDCVHFMLNIIKFAKINLVRYCKNEMCLCNNFILFSILKYTVIMTNRYFYSQKNKYQINILLSLTNALTKYNYDDFDI